MTNPKNIDASILVMNLSGGRSDLYTRITCDGRSFDVRKYSGEFRNRAEYELDMLKHVLHGKERPRIADDKYRDPPEAILERSNILEDAKTHRVNWVGLFDEKIASTDNDADKSYWKHEREAFVRLLDIISD